MWNGSRLFSAERDGYSNRKTNATIPVTHGNTRMALIRGDPLWISSQTVPAIVFLQITESRKELEVTLEKLEAATPAKP